MNKLSPAQSRIMVELQLGGFIKRLKHPDSYHLYRFKPQLGTRSPQLIHFSIQEHTIRSMKRNKLISERRVLPREKFPDGTTNNTSFRVFVYELSPSFLEKK